MDTTKNGSEPVAGSNPAITLIRPCLLSAILFFTISIPADYVEAAPSTSTTDRGIHFQFDEATGELTIADGGQDLTVPREIVQKGKLRPLRVWFKDPSMKVPLHGNDQRIKAIQKGYNRHYASDDQVVLEESFAPEKRRLLNRYRWGKVVYEFKPQGERLELVIAVHNA